MEIIKKGMPKIALTKGQNTCEFIVIHHTATGPGTLNGVLNGFLNGNRASCHFTIDRDGKIYQVGEENSILWHAGLSSRKGKTDLKYYSIGIEVIGGVSKDDKFTDEQRQSLKELVLYLKQKYNIPKENILRHKDISPGRKVDIYDTFWNNKYNSWNDYINSNFGNMETNYTKILENNLQKTGLKPLFENYDEDRKIKELINIAIIRAIDKGYFIKK